MNRSKKATGLKLIKLKGHVRNSYKTFFLILFKMFCQSFLAKTKRNGKMIRKLKNEVSKNREEIKFLTEEIQKLNKIVFSTYNDI